MLRADGNLLGQRVAELPGGCQVRFARQPYQRAGFPGVDGDRAGLHLQPSHATYGIPKQAVIGLGLITGEGPGDRCPEADREVSSLSCPC